MKRVCLYRLCGIVFALLLLMGKAETAALPEPVINARAAILVEASTGRILYEKNADVVNHPASMTKMMTCILALETGKADDRIVISNFAMETSYHELEFKTGEVLSLGELLEGMMLLSDNVAATAIAENLAPTYGSFIELMNRRAKELGLQNTHFVNPHGLTDDLHYSTARDMMKIARCGWSKPAFRNLVGEQTGLVEWSKPTWRKDWVENTNELLNEYPGMVGIKTGWTEAAGGCLASAAERNGVTLIAIVMNAESVSERFADTRKLMDYGFSAVKGVKGPVKERMGKKIAVNGSRKGHIMAYPAFDICYPLLQGENAENFSLRYELPAYVKAPVKKGRQVGEVVVLYKRKEIGRIPVIAAEDAEPGFSLLAFAEGIFDNLYTILFC